MNKIKKILFNEYLLAFLFFSSMTGWLFVLAKNHDPYFRTLCDPSQHFVWYPAALMLKKLMFNGFSFLWSPLFGLGIPFLADPILSGVLPYKIILLFAPNLYLCTILVTAGFFTYMFCRLMGMGKGSSIFAGIYFMFNAYFIQLLNHSQLEVDAFLPVVFYFSFYLIEIKANWIRTFLAALVIAVSILGMSPESTFYIFFLFSIYFVGYALYAVIKKEQFYYSRMIYVLVAFVLGILLSCYHLFPVLEYLFGHVSNYRSHNIGMTSNPLSYLLAMLTPEYYYGLHWIYTPFVETRTLIVFVLIGILSAVRKPTIFKTLTIFSLFIIMGFGYGYLTKPLAKMHIPLLTYMYHEKHSIPAIAFGIALLGGLGLDFIIKFINDTIVRRVFLVVIILLASYEVLSFYKREPVTASFSPVSFEKTPLYVDFFKNDKTLYRMYANQYDGFDKSLFYSPFVGNYIQIYNIDSIGFTVCYNSYRFSNYVRTLLGGSTYGWTLFIDKIDAYTSPLFNLMNVKYIAGIALPDLEKMTDRQYELVFDKQVGVGGQGPVIVKIYRNNKVLPRAFMVYNPKYLLEENKIIKALRNPNFNPKETIIIENKPIEEIELSKNTNNENDSLVEIISYKSTEIDIKVNTNNSGFLFLGDNYYPGWRVYVDGKEDKIYRANYLFRSVYLHKGMHEVKFVFDSISFELGLYISLTTLLLFVFLIMYQMNKTSLYFVKAVTAIYIVSVITCVIVYYINFQKNADQFFLKDKLSKTLKDSAVVVPTTEVKVTEMKPGLSISSVGYIVDKNNGWMNSSNVNDVLNIEFNTSQLKLRILANSNCGVAVVKIDGKYLSGDEYYLEDIVGSDIKIDDKKGSVTGIPFATYIDTYNSSALWKEYELIKNLKNDKKTKHKITLETVKPLILIGGYII